MATNLINYFVDYLGIYTGNFAVYYNFNTTGVPVIPSVSGGQPQYSGFLSSIGNFYQQSGSGYFTGQNVAISNYLELDSTNWTMYFVYQRTDSGNGVLFSNFGGRSGLYSGFVLGVNDANRFYVQSHNQDGPLVLTSEIVPADKNILVVSKTENAVEVGRYDFNNRTIESEQFNFDTTFFDTDHPWYLGAAINAPSYFSGNPFVGYMDEFLYFKENSFNIYKRILCSGFFARQTIIPPPVTGYILTQSSGTLGGVPFITTETGYFSGLIGFADQSIPVNTNTGINKSIVGYLNDTCDIQTPVYDYDGITGTISYNMLTPIYGVYINVSTSSGVNYTTSYPSGIVYIYSTGNNSYTLQDDNQFIKTFGMDEITYLRSIDSNDLGDLETFSTGFFYHNKLAQFNLDGNPRTDAVYTARNLCLYLNGIGQLPSGVVYSGNSYSGTYVFSGDYNISGNALLHGNYYSGSDVFIYDVIEGIKNYYRSTGVSNIPFSSNSKNLYLNGVHLTSGLHYSTSGNTTSIIDTDLQTISGMYYTFNKSLPDNLNTGIFFHTGVNKFLKGTSMLWMNGQRQYLNVAYVENSALDYIQNGGILDILNNAYNNEGNFLENI